MSPGTQFSQLFCSAPDTLYQAANQSSLQRFDGANSVFVLYGNRSDKNNKERGRYMSGSVPMPLQEMDNNQQFGNTILRAGSDNPDPALAARELFRGLQGHNSACIVFYCSADYRLDLLSEELNRLFHGVRIIGCTTAGEITPLGYRKNAITGFSLPRSHFAVETVLIEDLAHFSEHEARLLVSHMVERLENKAVAPISGHSFALSLLDGLSIREELVLKALSTGLADIPLVGGSAGDNLHFQDTSVYFEGEFKTRSAILTLVNTTCPFRVFSTHHLVSQQDKLVVTSASPYERVVHELNAEPAALEYCRVHGLSFDELQPATFALHPLAVQLSDEMYVRAVQKVNDDLSLTFFCAIDLGVVLTKMTTGGLLEQSKLLLDGIQEQIGEPQIVIGFDCIYRRCEIDHLGIIEEMSELYARHRVIGFSTYGEQVDGMHLNHTFTGVVIGQ